MPLQNPRSISSVAHVLLLTAALFFPLQNTWAAEPVPGGSCAGFPTGTYAQSGGLEIVGGHMLVCDGTNWLSIFSYNDTAKLITLGNQTCNSGEVLAFDGTIWACSAAGGSGIWETDTNVTRPTSGIADYTTDDFVFGSYQLDDTTNAEHDKRMFFDKSKAAFRAGRVIGTEWDSGSVGDNSTAFGNSNTASGDDSMAWGSGATANAYSSTAWGFNTTASGNYSTAWGGSTAVASGDYSTTWGLGTHAGSFYETSIGRYPINTAGNLVSWVATDTLFEIGNGASDGSRANALTLLKNGKLGLGDSSPDGSLLLDVEGDIGAANYCDEDGDNCFTAASVSSSVWETNANVTRPTSGTADYAIDDFVFGSPQLDDTGNTDHDRRMFFDKNRAAFRAGYVNGTQWDEANIGSYSTAWGYGTTASGNNSTAWGESTTASDYYSTAFGYNTTASGSYSTTWGSDTTASSPYSTAWGSNTIASGYLSTAWGSNTIPSGTLSTAWGSNTHAGSNLETSLGRYSLNTTGTPGSWVATDTLFEIGNGASDGSRANALTLLKNGKLGIGTAAPESTLHIPDGKYFQAEDNNAGPPPAGDCDDNAELGRMSIDITNNRLYVCMGVSRGWDYSSLTD